MIDSRLIVASALLGVSFVCCSRQSSQVASAEPACAARTLIVTNNLSASFPVYWLGPGVSPSDPNPATGRTLLGTARQGVSRFVIPTPGGEGQPQLGIQHPGPINAQEASYRIECSAA